MINSSTDGSRDNTADLCLRHCCYGNTVQYRVLWMGDSTCSGI